MVGDDMEGVKTENGHESRPNFQPIRESAARSSVPIITIRHLHHFCTQYGSTSYHPALSEVGEWPYCAAGLDAEWQLAPAHNVS